MEVLFKVYGVQDKGKSPERLMRRRKGFKKKEDMLLPPIEMDYVRLVLSKGEKEFSEEWRSDG
jgi:hypothetical protein